MARSSSMSAFTKAASATGVVGAVAFSVLAGGMSASAAPIDCAALGATTVAPGICQIIVTTSGTFSIGAPVGVTVTHLEALLVAGGTAGEGYDGGFGGEVVYVNDVPLTPLTVTIGAGGVFEGSAAGTTAIADGNGAVTAEPATSSIYGAGGVLPSSAAASALFPAYSGEQRVAGDGVNGVAFASSPTPAATDWTPAGGGTDGTFSTARPNSGAGGGGAYDNAVGGNGAAGVVIFRFAAPEAVVSPALAATGVDTSAATAAAGVLLLGGTAALIAGRRRRARA